MKCSRRKAPMGTTPLMECRRRSRNEVPSPARRGATPALILEATGLAVEATMKGSLRGRMWKLAIIGSNGDTSQGKLERQRSQSPQRKLGGQRQCAEFAEQKVAVLEFPLPSLRTPRSHPLIVVAPIPLQECAKSRATMAVQRFFLRTQIGKGLAEL